MLINDLLLNKIVIGIDEVGRGSWAGPLVVGAVILSAPIEGLTDSKLLSKAAREAIAARLIAVSESYSLGWVTPQEVDELGLTAGTRLAIERAIQAMPAHDYIVIDGSVNFLPDNPKAVTCVKADSLVPAVSAASILAKVERDAYMTEQDTLYPDYGFASNVGYGTAQHRLALASKGVTSLHRLSYKPVQQFL